MIKEKQLTPVKAALIFIGFTLYFYLLLFTLLPIIKANIRLNPALYWFITGYFLFIPLFISALILARREGAASARELLESLHVRPFTKRDWAYAIAGLALVFVVTGTIFGASAALHRYCGTRMLSTTPWFMEFRPFEGTEKLLLFVWVPMFFFNIAGEELLWRGYIQARLRFTYAWPLCSLLWLGFHLPFGLDLMIMLVPVVIIIPCAFHRTGNALVGVFIHGMYNGPVFVALALGVMG